MRSILLLFSLLVVPLLSAQTLTTVLENGPRSTRVNIVFLSEGYTSGQMGTFEADVNTAVNFLLTKEPWSRYRTYCNIYRIAVASEESGTDNGAAGGPRNTYFHTGFNTPGIAQLNTISPTGSSRAYSLLNLHVPEYDIPIILVNDSKYGGSGGPLAVTTTNSQSAAILEHELGHSFAKLTDEYDESYAGYPATEFPNATALTNRAQIRWKDWIESATPLPTPENSGYASSVGLFEGANYRAVGWYRPHDDALMRSLNRPPGHVTREAITLTYYTKISPIDSYSPTTLKQTYSSPVALALSVTPKVPATSPSLTVEWLIDNVPTGQSGTTLNLETRDLGNGTHVVKAIVRDPTPWVRRDPSGLVADEVSWTLALSNQIEPPVITTPLPASTVRPVGATLTLDATATGPGPINHLWLKNNRSFRPAITSPTLNFTSINLGHAGTYTARITNPGHTIPHTTALSVLNPQVPRVVIGKGRTATLAFQATGNLPPVSWTFGSTPVLNENGYIGATTRSLRIPNVSETDSGQYFFSCGDYGPSPPIELLVVTAAPDYAGTNPSLPVSIVGKSESWSFPLPLSSLQTPNFFSARLPAGLRMNLRTGEITGTPTAPSRDQVLGDEITFTVGNEFGRIPLKMRLLIKALPPGIDGSFSGFISVNSSLGGPTGGRIDLAVQRSGAYSGRTTVGTEKLGFRGKLSVSGPDATSATGSFTVKPKHAAAPIPVPFAIEGADDSDPDTATLDAAAGCFAWRNKWLPPESDDPFKGYFTFAFSADPGATTPKGNGIGSVTIDTNGRTAVTGQLADGERFATASHLSPVGGILVYQSLYSTATKGYLNCILDLEPGVSPAPPVFSAANSDAVWLRPADPRPGARTYKDGFEINLSPMGSLYVPPSSTGIAMGLPPASGSPPTNARLEFDALLGEDPLPVIPDVGMELRPRNVARINAPNPKSLRFGITSSNGRFSGSYVTVDDDPRPAVPPAVTRRKISRTVRYYGIIATHEGTPSGFGFFLRDALPKADGSTTPLTSPRDSGALSLEAYPP